VGALVAFVLALTLAQHAPTQEGAAEFLKLEDVWNQAHLQSDAATLDGLWADDIVVIVPKMPPFAKSDALSVFRSGRMKFQRYATSDIKVRTYGGCVVVTGRLRRSRTMGDRVVDDDWLFTKVYVRGPKAWQVVTFHASEAGE
jgi:ketosteroid isomerase-like protein